MIDFRISTFLNLCETRSYTKTAENLLMTQPSVSQHIRYLERHYGCKLFSYQGRTLNLTLQGELLYKYALTSDADSKKIVKKMEQSKANKLKWNFGTTLSIGEYAMTHAIEKMLTHGIRFTMYVENTERLLQMLHKGEIDFAFVEGKFSKEDYGYALFSSEPFIAICSPENELCKKTTVELEDILKFPLILREHGSGTREIFEAALGERGFSVNSFAYLAEIANMNVIKEMVQKNFGITFLYRRTVEKELAEGKLYQIPLSTLKLTREFNFVFLKDSVFTNEYMSFFDFCKR